MAQLQSHSTEKSGPTPQCQQGQDRCPALVPLSDCKEALSPHWVGVREGQVGNWHFYVCWGATNPHTVQCQWRPYGESRLPPQQAATNFFYPQTLCQCRPHVETKLSPCSAEMESHRPLSVMEVEWRIWTSISTSSNSVVPLPLSLLRPCQKKPVTEMVLTFPSAWPNLWQISSCL